MRAITLRRFSSSLLPHEAPLLARLTATPSLAYTLLPGYFKRNSGTVEGLAEIWKLVSKNFWTLADRDPRCFRSLLTLLCRYDLAGNSVLLPQVSEYISEKMVDIDPYQSARLTALNCARLSDTWNLRAIEDYINPTCDKVMERLGKVSPEQILATSLVCRMKTYSSLAYLRYFRNGKGCCETLLAALSKYFASTKLSTSGANTSPYQERVYRRLSSRGIPYEKEKQIMVYIADVVIPPKIVIEVMGDFHVFADTDICLTPTVLKLDLLRREGYEVIPIRIRGSWWHKQQAEHIDSALEEIYKRTDALRKAKK